MVPFNGLDCYLPEKGRPNAKYFIIIQDSKFCLIYGYVCMQILRLRSTKGNRKPIIPVMLLP